ncbi:hypothetical protein [Streptomyces sp. NPDC048392]|uniref:hypothetical protein n=1 Tax=Streptomyces sp. NPDC048392 TaxID=3365543 RepID=UPI00372338AC
MPDSRLTRRTLGRRHARRGEVRFRPVGEGGTSMTVRTSVQPRGPTGALTAVPGAAGRLVRPELAAFETGFETAFETGFETAFETGFESHGYASGARRGPSGAGRYGRGSRKRRGAGW